MEAEGGLAAWPSCSAIAACASASRSAKCWWTASLPFQRRRPGAEHLDQEGAREGRVVGQQLQVDLGAGARALQRPAGGRSASPMARKAPSTPASYAGQEALFLVGEVLVERAARDARPLDDVGDRHVGVALGRGRVGHGDQQSLALGLGDHRARCRVAAARQDAQRVDLS